MSGRERQSENNSTLPLQDSMSPPCSLLAQFHPVENRGKESETGAEGPYMAGENVGLQNRWQ